MAAKLIWLQVAKEDLSNIDQYLREHGTQTTVKAFRNRVKTVLKQLGNFPVSGTETQGNRVRKIYIDNFRAMFYDFEDNVIVVLRVFDMRQDPGKNLFE